MLTKEWPAGMSRAALGEIGADAVLVRCSVVSVYTGEIVPDTQIAISGSRISYVGPDASHTIKPHTRITDVKGRHVIPGLADPHTHIDQYVLPSETASCVLKHGTTSLFSDPIDITGVGGYRGFSWFVEACRGLPVRVFHGIPGGLPVDPAFSHASGLTASEERAALEDPAVFGMGEVFSWTKVTQNHPSTMESIHRVLGAGGTVNGHTAGMSGKKLASYAAAGVMSCHEPIDFDQTLERLRMGMHVMVREGSIRRDLRDIVAEVSSRRISTGRLMFCSDGLNPADMESGHMDRCVREAVKAGISPPDAVAMATLNVFAYYGMDWNLGGIAPGRLADIIILDDLERFRINAVMVGGRVWDGRPPARTGVSDWLKKTVVLPRITPGDFAIRAGGDTATANTIRLRTEIITVPGSVEVSVRDGIAVTPGGDVWKVAAFDRAGGTGNRGLGFLEGFGTGEGAVATTASFHENDIVVIGSSDSDMAEAVNGAATSGGGTAVVKSGSLVAELPMPVAGLMSGDDARTVREGFEAVNGAMKDFMGCRFENPHQIPLFLPFLALPHIRILSRGMVNVREGRIVPALA